MKFITNKNNSGNRKAENRVGENFNFEIYVEKEKRPKRQQF